MPSEVSIAGSEQDLSRVVAELRRELTDAHRREVATAEVLRVIGSSANNLQSVFQAIVTNSARLCDAAFSAVAMFERGLLRLVAVNEMSSEETKAYHTVFPRSPGRNFIMGRAFIDRQPVHVEDIEADPDYDPQTLATLKAAAPYRSFLGIPILRHGVAIGAIGCGRRVVKSFTDAQIALVKSFADQAVIAIENTRLFEEVEARTRELTEALEQQTATSDVLSVISRSPAELEPVLRAIIETASRLCQSDNAYMFTLQEGCFRPVAYDRAEAQFLDYLRANPISPDQRGSITARAAREQRTIHVPDSLADPEFGIGPLSAAQRRTVLSVPLLRDGATVGVITMDRIEVRPYLEKQIELVESFADQAVIAIENTRLFEAEQARTLELGTALEYQQATSRVLEVISGSPTDVRPVFETIARDACRLGEAQFSACYLFDGELLRPMASQGFSDEAKAVIARLYPMAPSGTSVSARAVRERRIVQVRDATCDEGEAARELAQLMGYRAIVAVPMLSDNETLGCISLGRSATDEFTPQQVALLRTFADQAVIAIENTRLFEAEQAGKRELQESLEYQTAISEVLNVISRSPTDVQPVFDAIASSAARLCEAQFCNVFRYDGQHVHFAASYGTTPEDRDKLRHITPLRPSRVFAAARAILNNSVEEIIDIDSDSDYAFREAARSASFRSAVAVPMRKDGEPIGAIAVVRSQVGRFPKRQIALLKTFADQAVIAIENARLFEEVQARTRELAKSVEDLEVASQHKSQFVANMSHELRTPLAAILGYAELMQEGFYGTPSEKSLDALTRIRSNGKHLLGLINTVLDIAKIESGQFTLNMGEYAVESVVETVRSATESLAQNKKLALKTDVAKSLPFGLGDEQRLTQVLLNLVGNAIKFTDAGEVRVSAQAVNGNFNVSVADTGPGIPADQLTRIFEQFHQVDSSNTKAKGGTGLGLAISKQIVEMHGGRIWVESILGKGSTFHMELPIRASFRGAA
jgi:signal transduction histidine kinase